MDLDLRTVRAFTIVAEHRNFGRAATALRTPQPLLSRQIRNLEDQLGVRLFVRTSRGSILTDAGRVFLPHAHELLRAAREATLATRAAVPASAIVIGHIEGVDITPAVLELRHRYPDARVSSCVLSWQQTRSLDDRSVDALVARLPLPFPADDLWVTILGDEPRTAVLPIAHRLAGNESITVDDLTDDELVDCTHSATTWTTPESDGIADKLDQIAGGHRIAILPAGDRPGTLPADVVGVPIGGMDPCQVVAATHADDHNPLVAAFHDVAARTLKQSLTSG